MENILTMTHANVNVGIHLHANTLTDMIHTHASVSASLTTVQVPIHLIKRSASVSVGPTQIYGVRTTMCTTVILVDVPVRESALHHTSLIQTGVSVCAMRHVHLGTD